MMFARPPEMDCPMILVRRTSFLEKGCEESPVVACNLYEAAELVLAAGTQDRARP